MLPTILTSETHTIYTLDSDLSYSKLLALSNLSYSASFLEKNQSSAGLTVGTLVTLVGGTPRCTDNVSGHRLLLWD